MTEVTTTHVMTPKAFTANVSAITSAFGDPTRRGIYLFVREADHGVTAAQAKGPCHVRTRTQAFAVDDGSFSRAFALGVAVVGLQL